MQFPLDVMLPWTESWAPPGTASDSDSSRSPGNTNSQNWNTSCDINRNYWQVNQVAETWLVDCDLIWILLSVYQKNEEPCRWSTDLQVSADPPEDVVDAVSGQQGHEHILHTDTNQVTGATKYWTDPAASLRTARLKIILKYLSKCP